MSAGTTGNKSADAAAGVDPTTAAPAETDPEAPASLEEQLRAVERDVRELVRLHGDLARFEARSGLLRLLLGMFMMGVGVFVAGFVLLAAGFAFYLSLVRVMPPAGAATVVAAGFALTSLGAWFLAWRLLQGAGSLLLPRTRALLSEMFTWRNKPTGS